MVFPETICGKKKISNISQDDTNDQNIGMGWDDEKGNFLVKFFHVISYPNPIVKQAGDRKRQQ